MLTLVSSNLLGNVRTLIVAFYYSGFAQLGRTPDVVGGSGIRDPLEKIFTDS